MQGHCLDGLKMAAQQPGEDSFSGMYHSVKSADPGSARQQLEIFRATQLGDVAICKILVEKYGLQILSMVDDKGHTPIHWACLAGHNEVLKYFISLGAPLNTGSQNELSPKPIHWACVHGHIVTVDILLQNGVSIDTTDNRNCTPLIIAAQYGKLNLVGYLIGKGARKDLTDVDGDNALHWACFKGYSEIVQLLLYVGLSVKQRDDVGQTPIHLACLSGDSSTVQLLLNQDVDVFAKDSNGKTPSDLATGRGHKEIIALLNVRMRRDQYCACLFRMIEGLAGDKKYVLFFLVSVLFFSYPIYFYYFWLLIQQFFFTNVVFLALNAVLWATFVKSARTDPGFLPTNTDEYDMALKRVSLHKEWETATENNPLSKLCHTCRLVRPVRAKHCRICRRCVVHFDHHCQFIHNCVGPKNRVIFFVFFLTTLLSSYIAIFLFYHVILTYGWNVIHALFALFYAIYAPVFTYVFVAMVYQISINLTLNETLNFKRYPYLKDASGGFYNPFDRGLWNNWLEYFNLLPPRKLDKPQGDSPIAV